MYSAISSVDSRLRKNGHSAAISRCKSSEPSDSAAPAPYHDGSSTRFCVQAKTHGMARSASTPPELRLDGREPMFSAVSSEMGVTCSKKRGNSGSS